MFHKKKSIDALSVGEKVDDVFVVKIKRELRPYSKGYSFHLILSDASGQSLDYAYWGGQDEDVVKGLYDSVHQDDVVRLTGRVGRYRGKLQVSADPDDVLEALEDGEFDPSDFVMPPARDPDDMFDDLMEAVRAVGQEDIRRLLVAIFSDPDIREAIKRHPGGIEIHHNRVAGLLEHELEVLSYCMLSAEFFDLDRDLLTAGALLHDIGKLEELHMDTRIRATRGGQLLGHITQGLLMLDKFMDRMDTPPALRDKLLHMIVSHHGFNDYGSPKEPMFPEALCVHLADMLSSKLGEMETFIKKVRGTTEDEFAYYGRGHKNILLK